MSLAEYSQVLDLGLDYGIFTKSFLNTRKLAAKSIHIIFFHDLWDYHGRYQEIVNFYSEQSVSYSFSFIDIPGFGKSHPDIFFDFEKINKATTNFTKEIFEKFPNAKIYLMGQGFGGLLALNLALQTNQEIQGKISGIILSNPILKIQSQFSNGLRQKISISGKDLTSDISRVNDFETDLLIKKVVRKQHWDMMKNLGYELRGQAYFIKKPILCLLSGHDAIADSSFTKLFLKGIDKSIVTMREYSQEKHDLLNENCRKKVFSNIHNWIV